MNAASCSLRCRSRSRSVSQTTVASVGGSERAISLKNLEGAVADREPGAMQLELPRGHGLCNPRKAHEVGEGDLDDLPFGAALPLLDAREVQCLHARGV